MIDVMNTRVSAYDQGRDRRNGATKSQLNKHRAFWPQRTAHKILNALDSEFSLVHSDAWQCAMEVAIGLYRGPQLSAPLYVMIVTDEPQEVALFARCLRRVLGQVRKNDPGCGLYNPQKMECRAPRRVIKIMPEVFALGQKPIVISKGTRTQPRNHFRPIHVLGLVDGAASIMEQVLTQEREHGYSWTRSQDLVMRLARSQCVADTWSSKVLEQVEAVYLKRNATHRVLMNAGDDLQTEARALIRNALNEHHMRGTHLSCDEAKALFGGQSEEWILWLSLQLASNDMIASHVAAEWLATCV